MAGQYMFTFVVLAVALVALPNVIFGAEYVVGDDKGWKLDIDYAAWAKDKTFRVGDKLVFKYLPGSHNVNSVDEAGYKNCIIPQTGALMSGQDTITLDSPGPKYYVCGVGLHCEKGNQKLQINVEAAAGGATEGAKPSPHAPATNASATAPAPTPSAGIRSAEFGVPVAVAMSMMALVF